MLVAEDSRSPVGPTPRPDVSELYSRTVEAPEATVRNAARSIDLVGPLVEGLIAIGVEDHIVTPCADGLVWRFEPEAPGRVWLAWSVAVVPETADTSLVSISLSASDEGSRDRLLEGWPVIGPIAELQVHRVLHRIEALAEEAGDDPFEGAAPARRYLRAVS